jgi:DNA-binding NarL/FixJ family response regulator
MTTYRDRTSALTHPPELAEREKRVLELLWQGESTGTIARSMGVKVTTVRQYVMSIAAKFGTRSGQIRRALQHEAKRAKL